MRSAEQISRTPLQWAEARNAERQRNYAALMHDLRHARETEAEWYTWILNGRPTLTEAEYAKVGRMRKGKALSSHASQQRGRPAVDGPGASQPEEAA